MLVLASRIAVCAATCLNLGQPALFSQQAGPIPGCEIRSHSQSSSEIHEQQPSGPQIVITEVVFSGFLQLPTAEQGLIADLIKRETHGFSIDAVSDEAMERAKAGWQDNGYFKTEVSGQSKILSSGPSNQQISLTIRVDEGPQYRLGGIGFNNNKAMRVAVLRGLFPLKDGDIFSREKIAQGLEKLRTAYGEIGYINLTAIPNTSFDDEKQLISLTIDLDEGKQFHVASVDIIGLDEPSRQELLQAYPIGQVYSARHFQEVLEKHSRIWQFSADDPFHSSRRLDERTGTVTITLDARLCPAE